MICPVCRAYVKKRSNFCRYCGHQMPVMVGVDYPFGLRFPRWGGPHYWSAVRQARLAPKYFEASVDGELLHTALYDRTTVDDLAALDRFLFFHQPAVPSLIEHTTDGRTFFKGPSFWPCFAKRLAGAGIEWPEVAHAGARCHSYFGCLAAQRRQDAMYHQEGWEVFYHLRHGAFGGDTGPEAADAVYRDRPGHRELSRLLDTRGFSLDRGKVKTEVMRLISSTGSHRCPLFSPAYLEQQIAKLPSLVVPCGMNLIGETPGWSFLNCAMHGPAVCYRCYDGSVDVVPAK